MGVYVTSHSNSCTKWMINKKIQSAPVPWVMLPMLHQFRSWTLGELCCSDTVNLLQHEITTDLLSVAYMVYPDVWLQLYDA
jgi:hypothetical protein